MTTETPVAEADLSFAPSHVPPERIWPHDLNAYARQLDDPFEITGHLRRGPDLVYSRGATRGLPGWVPTRSALLGEIFLDADRFSSENNVGVGPLIGVDWKLNPIDVDPPDHFRYRLVMQPSFTPAAINRHDEMIRVIARELIARFADRGQCDFMEDFANFFPTYVFLAMANLPREMLPQFLVWEHGFIRGSVMEERAASLKAIVAYLEGVVAQRRGIAGDDVLSTIINGEINGRPLDHGEIMGMCLVLYLGGLDTVLSSLGWHIQHVARDRELQARLRERPEDIPATVDDLFRCYGVTTTRRYVREDIDFHGVAMKKGDRILMPTYVASRDPDEFPEPERVDPDRKPRHLTFATGRHNCIGAHLARREVRIVLEEFLSRFTDISISAGETPRWQTDGVWSMTYLPLSLRSGA